MISDALARSRAGTCARVCSDPTRADSGSQPKTCSPENPLLSGLRIACIGRFGSSISRDSRCLGARGRRLGQEVRPKMYYNRTNFVPGTLMAVTGGLAQFRSRRSQRREAQTEWEAMGSRSQGPYSVNTLQNRNVPSFCPSLILARPCSYDTFFQLVYFSLIQTYGRHYWHTCIQ